MRNRQKLPDKPTLATQAEADRLAALRQQAEAERLARLERQADADRLAEEQRQAEEQRLADNERETAARIAAERRQMEAAAADLVATESRANDVATSSPLGVGAAIPTRSTATRAKPTSVATAVAPKPRPTVANASAGAGVTTFGLSGAAVANNAAERPLGEARQQLPAIPVQQAQSVAPAPATSSGPVEPEIVPISQLTRTNYVGPEYPRAARRRGITGAVDLTFTVSKNGQVSDIAISRSEPRDTFDQAAMDAVQSWRFAPVIENGAAVEKRSAVRLSFDLQ